MGNQRAMKGCPYGADGCPKIEDLEQEVKDTRAMIYRMMRTLYLIAGILTVNLGITII